MKRTTVAGSALLLAGVLAVSTPVLAQGSGSATMDSIKSRGTPYTNTSCLATTHST